jgi:hypothetical protein
MNQICDGEIGTSLAWNRFDSLSRPRRQALSGGRAAIRRRRSVTFIPRSHHGPRASGEVMDREWENGRARLHESPNGPEHAAVDRSVSQPSPVRVLAEPELGLLSALLSKEFAKPW